MLTHSQIEDLLCNVIGVEKINHWKGDKIQFTCPVHHESHPSCGINADYGSDHVAVFHCFSCGAKGTLVWLLYKSLPDRFKSVKSAEEFMQKRYGYSVATQFSSAEANLKEYDDYFNETLLPVSRHEMPRFALAPYRSGKETYQYFFDRGFDVEDVKKFMIGRDLESETVTIPAFWEDGTLAGIIGRYIDPHRRKNERYKIYSFPKGSLIYPLDKLVVSNDTIIGVESMLDVIMLHKWGIQNAIAILGNSMSKAQADQVASRCKKFIAMFDTDERGQSAIEPAKKLLGGRVMFLTPTYHPEKGKDPSEWGELETLKVIKSASLFNVDSLPKL